MRYSRKDAERAFERLCALLDKEASVYGRDGARWAIGAWRLDFDGAYGGYQVQEIVNSQGAVTCPLGDMRRTAREFCESVYFVQRCLEAKS